MLEAHAERRRRELQELGSVTAIAMNDPKRLKELGASKAVAATEEAGAFQKWTWGGSDGK